jgi:uncharacterized integral membrane protein
MRIKTIIIVIITILLTVVLMQNTERVNFNVLWATFPMSKLVMLAIVAAFGFILGLLVARPKRVKRLADEPAYNTPENKKTNTLSDEDKNYIN